MNQYKMSSNKFRFSRAPGCFLFEFRESGGGLFQAAALVLVASPLKIAAEYGSSAASEISRPHDLPRNYWKILLPWGR